MWYKAYSFISNISQLIEGICNKSDVIVLSAFVGSTDNCAQRPRNQAIHLIISKFKYNNKFNPFSVQEMYYCKIHSCAYGMAYIRCLRITLNTNSFRVYAHYIIIKCEY